MNDFLTEEQITEYVFLNLSTEGIIKKAYQDGYEQAMKDMQHFEETGVVIL